MRQGVLLLLLCGACSARGFVRVERSGEGSSLLMASSEFNRITTQRQEGWVITLDEADRDPDGPLMVRPTKIVIRLPDAVRRNETISLPRSDAAVLVTYAAPGEWHGPWGFETGTITVEHFDAESGEICGRFSCRRRFRLDMLRAGAFKRDGISERRGLTQEQYEAIFLLFPNADDPETITGWFGAPPKEVVK
ncbi:MAG: hypothetical protein ACYSX0_22130 [Planctomycetota bacterium]